MRLATTLKGKTDKLATTLLTSGMLRGAAPQRISEVVDHLATRDRFHSHGSVLDAREASERGLNVRELPHTDELWQKFWLLRTMYSYDCERNGLAKMF